MCNLIDRVAEEWYKLVCLNKFSFYFIHILLKVRGILTDQNSSSDIQGSTFYSPKLILIYLR
jgi:hypothetical protein